MKKSNFAALILGTVGALFFALGMCMALIPEWNMFHKGVALGAVGGVILIITWIVWRRLEGKAPIRVSGKAVASVALAVFGAIVFGLGMCLVMVFDKMLLGTIFGILGILLLLMLIPLVKVLHD